MEQYRKPTTDEDNYWQQWLQDAGSCELVGAETYHWPAAGNRVTAGMRLPKARVEKARGEGGHDARDILKEKVGNCASLDEVREVLLKERLGVLREIQDGASNLVYTDGVANAKVMVIGEAPGREEDRLGLPFVGRSGQLLNKMLASIGLSRQEQVLLTNVVYWRPPGNRNPSDSEVLACSPVVEKTIELVDPQIILLMGAVSMRAILRSESSIGSVRGKHQQYVLEKNAKTYDLLVTFHPSYLLRAPKMKTHAWRDMLMLKKLITHSSTGDQNE